MRCLPAYTTWWLADVYAPSDVPGVQYTLQPGFDGSAFGAPVRVNALGFRGATWARTKEPGALRVAMIGDSHVFGFGLPYAATMGEQLSRALGRRLGRPVEALNFGINGYNGAQELAVLRAVALAFDPDVVVLVPTSNDHEPAAWADLDGCLAPSPPDAHASWRQRLGAATARVLRTSALYRFVRRSWAMRSEGAGPRSGDVDPAWMPLPVDDLPPSAALDASVGHPLRTMIAAAEDTGASVVVAAFAAPLDYRRLVRRIAHDTDVPLLELLRLFPEARSWPDLLARFSLGWDSHLNARAHARFGRALAHAIAARVRAAHHLA